MKEAWQTLFPDIGEIKNQKLAKVACGVWDEMLPQSEWADVQSVPFSLAPGSGSLVAHTRATMRACLRIARALTGVYPGRVLDLDVLLLSALLHDVSKIVEYSPNGRTEAGNLYQHAFLAAHAALNAGMPEAVVSIIMLHTPQTNVPMKFLEGVILKHAEGGIAASGTDYQRQIDEAMA